MHERLASAAAPAASAPFNLIEFSLPSRLDDHAAVRRPAITEPVEIFGPATTLTPTGNLAPSIVLNGSQAGSGSVGLTIQSSGVQVDQLAIDSFSGGGVLFNGAAAGHGRLAIRNDFIGVNLAGSTPGTVAAGNGTFGVELAGGANGNYICSTT